MACSSLHRLKKFPALLLFGAFIVFPVLCQNAQEEKPESKEEKIKYFSSTSLSLLLTRGNKKDFSFSFDTEQNLHFYKNKLNLKGNIIFTQTNGEKKSEIFYSHLKYDRQINSRAYLLGILMLGRNKFAGYNSRFSSSAGAGYILLKREKIEISSEGALGWSSENNVKKIIRQVIDNETSIEETSVSDSFISSIISAKVIYNASPSAQLTHQEMLFFNMGDLKKYRLNSYSSISATISRHLALKTSLQINYEPHPVPGYKNTDLFLLSSLVIKI